MLTACLVVAACVNGWSCTNFIVGKKASADDSVIVSYSADSYGMFGFLCHYPAAVHAAGTMRNIYEWDTGKYLGQIKEAKQTYNVIGNMNEFQVTIGETTFGGRPELVDTTGVMDYGSLIYVALQRSRTAKEAIKVMTDLVKEYGYYSSGESFTIADPNEAWIMEMIGKGPGVKGAVWVAVRIPDDCIAAHANQSRIHQFDMNDKDNCLYSPDVISFAREKGYFDGVNKDFSFADAYCPLDFSGLRACEARVWSFYNMFSKVTGQAYLSYIQGESKEPMPLYINEKMYLEGVTLTQEEFYERLKNDEAISTSQPGPADVCGLWNTLLEKYDEVVHIPMSSGLSASCSTAMGLAIDYNGRVQVVDNQRISVTQRQSVMDAKMLAEAGKSAAEIKKILTDQKLDSSIYITLDTLKYLKKGGRITPAAAAIGTVLNLKPVLQIQGEKLDAYAKVRGKKQAKRAMLKAMKNDWETRFKEHASDGEMCLQAAYTGNLEEAEEFKREIQEVFPGMEIHMDPLSLSVACHIGYGALAVACSRKVTL